MFDSSSNINKLRELEELDDIELRDEPEMVVAVASSMAA
jgi:hypothetical protein